MSWGIFCLFLVNYLFDLFLFKCFKWSLIYWNLFLYFEDENDLLDNILFKCLLLELYMLKGVSFCFIKFKFIFVIKVINFYFFEIYFV